MEIKKVVPTTNNSTYITLAYIVGFIIFLIVWIYALFSWGFLIGLIFGWIPALIAGYIGGLLWPLVALVVLAVIYQINTVNNTSKSFVSTPNNYAITASPKPQFVYTGIVYDQSSKTITTDYFGNTVFSASFHNNSGSNIDTLFIETDILKPGVTDCTQKTNFIDTQNYTSYTFIPIGGVKRISYTIQNNNYPQSWTFCNFVKSAHIAN